MATTVETGNPLGPSGNLRRRQAVDRFMRGSATAAAVLAVGVLVVVVYSIAVQGGSQLSFGFLTKAPPLVGLPGGGIAPEIVGTFLIVALATAFALPLGVLIAIFLSEFSSPRTAYPIRLALDLLNGLPSIVIGVFAYGLIVYGGPQVAWAGSFALAIIMIPLIARATLEVLRLVPQAQRDAAHALGISRWRTTLGIVLPSCLSGILTGTVLAVARAAGETAPLLFTAFGNQFWNWKLNEPTAALPLQIFTYAISPYDDWHRQAWAGALVLIILIVGAVAAVRVAVRHGTLGGAA